MVVEISRDGHVRCRVENLNMTTKQSLSAAFDLTFDSQILTVFIALTAGQIEEIS